jgi:5'-deoxynucleotidase YfbR-like HD superfamily hydrolase
LLLDEPELRLIKAALCHDLSEQLTGDIPAPAKWAHQDLRDAEKRAQVAFDCEHGLAVELSTQEHLILKYADMLDLMASSGDMVRMGNTFALQIHHRISIHIHDTTRLDNHVTQKRIDDLWVYIHTMTKGDRP